ncbi:type VI secretion system Vgr family protein [Acinetobacter sp. NIPH 2699]|uniref:type VI secretion system Vgr family protein n=1 Tax=Acinetobacter sp. NIPH 2699 TaxID=2923433 RepID=UPI001F4BB67C|nr:type VI secretion system Vgr family protein [Acinetobacter sp. NIPH 2699]MCH7335467.1 type VI secretion system tip protein VgrG [Acinetobacter sp. NIPH 2699]
MLNSIFKVLESLGLTAQKRAIHIQFSNPTLNTEVFLQKIQGQHQLNHGLMAELICLSTNAHIPLKQFIGCQVAVDQVTDTGRLLRTTGMITEAVQGQSDGSLTLYKLKLQDATALWHKRRNSRVFMNKNVLDVVQILFKEWQQRSPLFASSLTLDLSGLTQDYDVRPFFMQSSETDYDFITRLFRSEGINWLIDEAQLTVPNSNSSIQAQKLRLIDDNNQYQALDRRNIRYHRSSATEQYDSMTSLIAERSLQPTAVHIQRWQADALEQDDGAGSVQTNHQHSQQHDVASLGLEDAWHFTPAWMQDLNGEDGATASGNKQIEVINKNILNYHNSQAKHFIAHSTVRDTQVGYWFKLTEHPEIDQHSGIDQEFLIIRKDWFNQNNLPKDLNQQISQLLEQSHWQNNSIQTNTVERQANQLTLQRRNIQTVPEYHPLQHRPAAHPQRAKVVGPTGEEIHVDEWGRIKVRFLFTRNDDHQHDGGAGSNDNDTDSAWVDVLTPWAGEGYGARFLPRIGEIVVIDFFDGNIDRPFVTGRLHEAQRSPTKFDVKGRLPDTKKLSGIRSKEVDGEGFNQLRFDDTTGQISAQLQSSHAASQLNLGKLSHPKTEAESEDRGEGFELRTDSSGAIRSKGLYISTFVQNQAEQTQLEVKEALDQFSESFEGMKALSEYAAKQQAEAADMLQHIDTYIQKIESQWADLKATKEALILMASPESIATVSGKDIHLHAKDSITVAGGQSVNVSTDENLILNAKKKVSVFAGQEDFKIYAAKGKLDVQVQDNALEAAARFDIKITSSEGRVEIQSPTEIVLKAKESALKINADGVTIITPRYFKAKAGQHVFTTGAAETPQLPIFPNNICWECLARRATQRGAFINKGEGV